MCFSRNLQFILWLWLSFVYNIYTIEINYVKVPNAVKNDTNRSVVLDCNYSIRPDDSELVVQWYLNEDLVYQWIPPNKPQSLGLLKDGVDLSYKATDDPKKVYRALKINNPTTSIAGEYKCLVTSFGDHDSRMKNMIVFEPEKHFIIRKTMDETYVNFTCLVTDVYPSPKLIIYRDVKNDFHYTMKISITEWNLKKNPKTEKYTMMIVGTSRVAEIDPATLIHCELKIPGTGYIKLKSLLYYPDLYKLGNGGIRQCFNNVILGIVSVLIIDIQLLSLRL